MYHSVAKSQGITWEHRINNLFVTSIVLPVDETFKVVRTPGDGKCFFYSVSQVLFGTIQGHKRVKEMIKDYALKHWNLLTEAKVFYKDASAYVADLQRDGYWGGSVEAEILSMRNNQPIIIWHAKDGYTITSASMWRGDRGKEEINLIQSYSNHFDAAYPPELKERDPPPKAASEEKEVLDAIGDVLVDEEEESDMETDTAMLEDTFLPSYESERIELLSKPVTPFVPITKRIPSRLEEMLVNEQTLPGKVGRQLNKLYSCNVSVLFINPGEALLIPSHSEVGGKFSISDLGRLWLSPSKKIRRENLNTVIAISDQLMAYVDKGYVLRTFTPKTFISRHAGLVPPDLVRDITLTATVVLLSTFLYKSRMVEKRTFIRSCLKDEGRVSGRKVSRILNKLTPYTLYSDPLSVVRQICLAMFAEECSRLVGLFANLGPISYLSLSSLELDSLTRNKYYQVLEELVKADTEDYDFSSKEIKDIKETVDCCKELRESVEKSAVETAMDRAASILGLTRKELPRRARDNKRELEKLLIGKFFNDRAISKFVSLQGRAYSGTNLSNLLSYTHNLLMSKDKFKLTEEDIGQLELEQRKVRSMLAKEERVPIAIICSMMENRFQNLFRRLPSSCAQECEILYDSIRNAESYASAWRSALRLKGVAYEGMFALKYNCTYIPEDLKPTLSMIVQTYYPDKFIDFLDKTQKRPEIRDYTPDFSICQMIVEHTEGILPAQLSSVQLQAQEADDLGVKLRRTKEKAFPLPEVPIKELRSLDRLKDLLMGGGKQNQPVHLKTENYDESEFEVTSREIIAIEVGYQTDVDGKVFSDTHKWQEAVKLLSKLGIKALVHICADSSNTKLSDWWIDQDDARLLKESISYLFHEMGENSPSDVTDLMVANISTTKVRAQLKSGTIVKTPVTTKDVAAAWNAKMDRIRVRPTGAVLTDDLMDTVKKALVEGVTMDRASSEKVIEEVILKNMDEIISLVESTKNRHEVTRNKITADKLILGWLTEDLKNCRCKACVEVVMKATNEMQSEDEAVKYICQQIQLSEHLECCHAETPALKPRSLFEVRCPDITTVKHITGDGSTDDSNLTELDKAIRLTLPGKTEKERKIKRGLEQLIRLSMHDSGIPCIKLPSGQILINRAAFNQIKAVGSKKPKPRDEEVRDSKVERLSKLLHKDRLTGYSEKACRIMNDLLIKTHLQKNSKCCLKPEWAHSVLSDLKTDRTELDIASKLKETSEKRLQFVINNDKLIPVSNQEIREFLCNKSDSILNRKPNQKVFNLDCIIFKETVLEVLRRLNGTPYFDCMEIIATLTKLLLSFGWFQELVLYSKVCETFLQCCTEFNRSGIKLRRVRHTSINLAIQLPSNKKENMKCCCYNLDFSRNKSTFYMNRRVAVIGAAYPYIVIITFLQCMQHQRCLDELTKQHGNLMADILTSSAHLLDLLQVTLCHVNVGAFDIAAEKLKAHCLSVGNFLERSSYDMAISTISGLSVVFGLVLGDTFLLNSQPFNKQIQNMRFSMLAGLSKLVSPHELGKKLSSSSRRIEASISRLYLQLISYCCISEVEQNSDKWRQFDLCPNVFMPSLSIFGMNTSGDRQLVFDIYLVHIYNKEMDNFDEGCIKVLEETAEKHMSWELSLMTDLEKGTKKHIRHARLLLGLPSLPRHELPMEEYCIDDNFSTESSTSAISSTRSFSSGKNIKTLFGRLKSEIKPFVVEDSLEVSRDEMNDFKQVITDVGKGYTYEPNIKRLYHNVKTIIKENPNHTLGSFELIQAFTELARKKFPAESIEKCRKDPRNWCSISEVVETTSIVSEPKHYISIKDAIKTITGCETKKFVKMLRNRLVKLGMEQGRDKVGEPSSFSLLESVDTLTESQKSNIKKGILEPSKLSFYTWRDIINKTLGETLLTNDGNMIYCWLKSMASGIKRGLKPYIKNLRYDREYKLDSLDTLKGILTSEEMLNLQLFLEVVKSVVDTSRGNEEEYYSVPLLYSVWSKFVSKVKFWKEIVEGSLSAAINCLADFKELIIMYTELNEQMKKYDCLSFTREEIALKAQELRFLEQHGNDIVKFTNLIFFLCLACPWCMHYKSFELYLNKILETEPSKQLSNEAYNRLNMLGPVFFIQSGAFRDLCKTSDVSYPSPSEIESLDWLYRYCCALVSSNSEPLTAAVNAMKPDEAINTEQVLTKLRSILSKYNLEKSDLDFKWTISMIANSNFEVAKKLTGRTTGERLPRSVRSKVIYEMIKLVGSSGMAVLQQLAFSTILNHNHEFFAVLAPKAQLGGHRDLLVQESGTKVVHATTEMFSRTLLSTTNDDGLTNSHLKETILNDGLAKMMLSRQNHGKPVNDLGVEGCVQFFKVCCISGDNTKWGPIHCCSLFSGMMQQLLKDYPDWCNMYKLTFLKNLYRRVEIPSAAIGKILTAFKTRMASKYRLESMKENELRRLLNESIDIWKDQPMIQFLVRTYLCKGDMAMTCYNHMGQGIHHATSSILTSVMAEGMELIIREFCKKNFPELVVEVSHAGSSDDYAKTITLSGTVSKSTFERYNEMFWTQMCRLKNLMTGVGRCCQMKDSAKTLCGETMLEFYSEFMLSFRITPAVIKFIHTGLINSSVTSPQSMVQACQVSGQQAMYNSVPLITNICFTVLRQQMFFNHTEFFVREYGPIVQGLPSAFCRLYIPIYSNLTGSSIAVEDSESISQDLKLLKDMFPLLPSTRPLVLSKELEELAGSEDTRSTSWSQDSDKDTSKDSSSGSSSNFRFELRRELTETETEYLKSVHKDVDEASDLLVETRTRALFIGEEDYDEYPCLKKVKSSNLINSNFELQRYLETKPVLRTFGAIRSVICGIIAGYYRSFSSEGTEKTVKANLNRDENRVIEDPMIQLVPEKLRRELERLGLSRLSINELIGSSFSNLTFAEQVARRVVTMNCATEEYSSEIERLKQTLSSRNVIHGLAGGIKELSLPIYTIFLKSYFFKDNVFFDHEDRWNTQHSTNYRDSTGKKLDGKIVTKFTVWLDRILSSTLSVNYKSQELEPSLFNENLKLIEIIRLENGSTDLSVISGELEVFLKEFRSLAMQFSEQNRLKLKIVESRPHSKELDANKVIIVKSSIFNASEQVKIQNNPALIVGCMLSDTVIMDVKPAKVDYGGLMMDKHKVNCFYESVATVCSGISERSKLLESTEEVVDLDDVSTSANTLTMLCRLIQKQNNRLVNFYMIKPMATDTEPTVTDLVSYGTKEGRLLLLPEPSVEVSSFSVKDWKIMQSIACIANLNLTQQEKTDLLSSFLHWKPNKSVAMQECPLHKHEVSMLTEFQGASLLATLSSEALNIKNEKTRSQLEDLIDFIKDPNLLITKKPFIGTTAIFKTWGEGQKNGRFTFSSGNGESTGIFIRGKLHIYLSLESEILLSEVEKHVLGWMNRRRTDIVVKEQHDYFLNLLPTYPMVPRKHTDGYIKGVLISRNNPRLLGFVPARYNSLVVRIKKRILTVKKSTRTGDCSEPRLHWSPNAITIIYDELTESATYHEEVVKLRQTISAIIDPGKPVDVPSVVYQDFKIVIGKIRLDSEALLSSSILLHYYLCHSPEEVRMELSSKSQRMIELLTGESSFRNYRVSQKLLEDSSSVKKDLKATPNLQLNIAGEVEKYLNSIDAKVSDWSEIQQIFDETGCGGIEVHLEQKTLEDRVSWRCLLSKLSNRAPSMLTLRVLVSLVGSETLPNFLSGLLVHPTILNNLLKLGKLSKNELSASSLDDKGLDLFLCCCLYHLQAENKLLQCQTYSLSSILSLVSNKSFPFHETGKIEFNVDDEDELTLTLLIDIPPLRKGANKKEKAMAQGLALTAYNLLFDELNSFPELCKIAARWRLQHHPGRSEIYLEFGKNSATNTTLVKLLVGVGLGSKASVLRLSPLIQFISTLIGRVTPEYIISTNEPRPEPANLLEFATESDLLEISDDEVEDLKPEPTDGLFDLKF
uniref:RNA-directed RNA polymerase L n=1 Tax=Sulina virus TaxID=2811963 RepID=A0A893CDI9_9VIRU|nr:RdRp [Sulina virus]